MYLCDGFAGMILYDVEYQQIDNLMISNGYAIQG